MKTTLRAHSSMAGPPVRRVPFQPEFPTRGLGSRLALLALALVLGSAGGRSLATPLGGDAASCASGIVAAHPSGDRRAGSSAEGQRAAQGGWQATKPDRSGAGPEGEARPCRTVPPADARCRSTLASRNKHPDLRGPRAATGLLGLDASPANAPPGS